MKSKTVTKRDLQNVLKLNIRNAFGVEDSAFQSGKKLAEQAGVDYQVIEGILKLTIKEFDRGDATRLDNFFADFPYSSHLRKFEDYFGNLNVLHFDISRAKIIKPEETGEQKEARKIAARRRRLVVGNRRAVSHAEMIAANHERGNLKAEIREPGSSRGR